MRQKRKLEIEMVPESAWNQNLRYIFSRKEWDLMRKKVYADYNHLCGICGARGRLAAHEIWRWNDNTEEQHLVGLIALCNMCHFCKHIGFATHLASENKLDFNAVVAHYCRINGCALADFEADYDKALRQWKRRSTRPWKLILDIPGAQNALDKKAGMK